MSKQDSLRKVEQTSIPRLPLLKMGQTFLLWKDENVNLADLPVLEFDGWAGSLVDEITGVKRDMWDVFARWRFINFLLTESILEMEVQPDGTILLSETEEKTSELVPVEAAQTAQEAQS